MQEGRNPGIQPAADPVEGSDEEEARKRYYSPREVMKKKGCIGCGGVTLSVLMLIAALAWSIAAL